MSTSDVVSTNLVCSFDDPCYPCMLVCTVKLYDEQLESVPVTPARSGLEHADYFSPFCQLGRGFNLCTALCIVLYICSWPRTLFPIEIGRLHVIYI